MISRFGDAHRGKRFASRSWPRLALLRHFRSDLAREGRSNTLSPGRSPPSTPLFAHGPLQLEFPFNLFQILALATIKFSILFLYRRIFRGQAFNIASWVLIGIVIAWAITFVVALLAACGTSFAANFQMLAALKRECVNTFKILKAFAVSDVAVDLAILIMPIPLIKSSQWLYDSGGLD